MAELRGENDKLARAYAVDMEQHFPSPVLGETVLKYYPARGYEWNMKQQDSHTRKCLKEQGWKSPEEVRGIMKGIRQRLKEFRTPVKAYFSQPLFEDWETLMSELDVK